MSVSINNVPPWKRALLERKRSNEDGDRGCPTKEEGAGMSSLPSWKRDVLNKKQHTKNSFIFLGEKIPGNTTDKSANNSNQNLNSPSNSPEPGQHTEQPISSSSSGKKNGEHLPTLQENPWLKADSSRTKRDKQSHRLSDSMIDRRSNHSSNHSCLETDGSRVTQNSHAVINNEEEVTYGKGFVHILLKKFSLMSNKDEEETYQLQSSHKGRISRSTENLLDSKLEYSSRSFSPQGRNESLSPRSHTLSQSSDTLPSPRVVFDEPGSSPREKHKMGFEDKAGTVTPEVFASDYESSPLDNSSSSVVAVSDDITDNSELPKRNIVASARCVFESYASHSDSKGQSISPRSPRSPRTKSVHSLIAVDRLSSSGDDQTIVKSIYDLDNSENRGGSNSSNVDANTAVLSPKATSDTFQQSRSKFFPGTSPGSANKDISNKVSTEKLDITVSSNGMDTQSHSKNDLVKGNTETTGKNSMFVKNAHGLKSSDIVNGHVNGTNTVSSLERAESPFKKRKAPTPVKIISNEQNDNKKHVTSVEVTNSTVKIKSVPQKLDNISTVTVTSQTKKAEIKTSHKVKNSDQGHSETTKNDAKRPNLSLKLDKAKPENVNSSEANKKTKVDEPHFPVKINTNRKAKFKVPSSSGPGSLLIRPASNMVQGKDAQFVSLDVKYHDIKTGDFAPAKKKPAYYDKHSDDSDEDELVTNIDDVIEGQDPEKDANANVPKKTKCKKYDFIGQGVVLSKSSLKSRKTKVWYSQENRHFCYILLVLNLPEIS